MIEASASARVQRAWQVLQGVLDPEVPALSVCDLGIVREVVEDVGVGNCAPGGHQGLRVVLTPTYSGCPATDVIERQVREALMADGLGPVRTELRRAPAWTTDWITPQGRERLREAGIAPPGAGAATAAVPIRLVGRTASRPARPPALDCPHCGSGQTEQLSAFGSTACKALWRCRACREPFDAFKCH